MLSDFSIFHFLFYFIIIFYYFWALTCIYFSIQFSAIMKAVCLFMFDIYIFC